MEKLLTKFIYLILQVLRLTYRFEYRNSDAIGLSRNKSEYNSFILASWHQNILSLLLGHTQNKFAMIVSHSKDGEYVSNICHSFGHTPVRGSSSRGAIKSLIEAIQKVKDGLPLAITVDGPRGPIFDVKLGVFEIAKKSQTPIIPVCIVPTSFWSINSAWDKFRIPRPFSKIIIQYGETISVEENTDKNQYPLMAEKLKHSLIEQEEKIASSFT
ncbi:lysophospholipid acyltransferase family protein [Halobacteriovorax sp. HLS]|uniref:lysophospholipid acyltransferase family protein n=1 Tax=Halobacteriovorax sp. HLS TaxID=2234000 RepID=UPI000FDBF9D2|nr:lysophospholipid acyltransferase family protein [Halobacteriovorax sp. HLS]